MAVTSYRGFKLETQGSGASDDIWQVRIKNRMLSGNMTALKKSIDWWCDTASIIDPEEFASLTSKREESVNIQEEFAGHTLKNDSGDPNGWYCMFNGKLIKGGKEKLKQYIHETLLEQKQAKK